MHEVEQAEVASQQKLQDRCGTGSRVQRLTCPVSGAGGKVVAVGVPPHHIHVRRVACTAQQRQKQQHTGRTQRRGAAGEALEFPPTLQVGISIPLDPSPNTHLRTGAAAGCGRCSTCALCGRRRQRQSRRARRWGRRPRPTLQRHRDEQGGVSLSGRRADTQAAPGGPAGNRSPHQHRSSRGGTGRPGTHPPTRQYVPLVQCHVGLGLHAPQPAGGRGTGAGQRHVKTGWNAQEWGALQAHTPHGAAHTHRHTHTGAGTHTQACTRTSRCRPPRRCRAAGCRARSRGRTRGPSAP